MKAIFQIPSVFIHENSPKQSHCIGICSERGQLPKASNTNSFLSNFYWSQEKYS